MTTIEETMQAQSDAVDDVRAQPDGTGNTSDQPVEETEGAPIDKAALWAQSPMFPASRPKQELKTVRLDQIVLDDIGELPDAPYAKTIDAVGLIQTVHLGPLEDGKYYVKEGRRRVIAARQTGLIRIPCIITGDDVSAEYIRYVAHTVRHGNPASEYAAITRLIQKHYAGEISNDSLNDLAKRTGSTRASLKKLLSLGELIPGLLDALMADRITNPVAYTAAKMTKEEQARALAILESTGALTAANLREIRQAGGRVEQEGLPGLDADLIKNEDQRVVLARETARKISDKLAELADVLSGKYTGAGDLALSNIVTELRTESNALNATLGLAYIPGEEDEDGDDE